MGDPGTPSDMGRRLHSRREALGLSLEEVASSAGVDPGYLQYLETSAVPDPTRGTLLRVASALETSPVALLGSEQAAPPGHGAAEAARKLVELDAAKSMELIGTQGVGRAVFVDDRGPVALPVNYVVTDGDIVFRTLQSTSIAAGAEDERISFEVDRVDSSFAEGWSVLVSGTALRVEDPTELAGAFHVPPVGAGAQVSYFRLTPDVVTGRELRRQSG